MNGWKDKEGNIRLMDERKSVKDRWQKRRQKDIEKQKERERERERERDDQKYYDQAWLCRK